MVSRFVFPSSNPARPLDGQNFYNRIFIPALEGDEAKKDVKIEGVCWHTLRHTFASRLVMAGVDIRTAQELMGYQNITVTMKYSHLSKDHKKEAVQKLLIKPVEEDKEEEEKRKGEKTSSSVEKAETQVSTVN